MNSDLTESGALSFALLESLVQSGLRFVTVCPGSRSQSLALAALELERRGRLRVTVRLDERQAGYMALGWALSSQKPAAVIVTSGTALGGLYPAAMEAKSAFIPLLLITADRPDRLHNQRANQTFNQTRLFSSTCLASLEISNRETGRAGALARIAMASALGDGRGLNPGQVGAVHINVKLDEPFATGKGFPPSSSPSLPAPRPAPIPYRNTYRLDSTPTLILAGTGAGDKPAKLAEKTGWPLIAEVTSGAHYSDRLITRYRRYLRTILARPSLPFRRAIVFGRPTLSREIPRLLSRPELETVIVAEIGREVYNPGGGRAVLEVEVDKDFRRQDFPIPRPGRTLSGSVVLDHGRLVEAVWNKTPPQIQLFLGSSRLIREMDERAGPKKLRVLANRGLSGIDGNVSAALGASLSWPGVTRALVGDLTFLCDVTALLKLELEAVARLQILVGVDGGGTIFTQLEAANTVRKDDFRRVLLTPAAVNMAAIARGFGWRYRRCTKLEELYSALADAETPGLVEVQLHQQGS